MMWDNSCSVHTHREYFERLRADLHHGCEYGDYTHTTWSASAHRRTRSRPKLSYKQYLSIIYTLHIADRLCCYGVRIQYVKPGFAHEFGGRTYIPRDYNY